MKVFIDRDELWPSYSLVPMNREPNDWNLWCEVDEETYNRYKMAMVEFDAVTELLGELYDKAEDEKEQRKWREKEG